MDLMETSSGWIRPVHNLDYLYGMKGKKSSKPKNMDDLSKRYNPALDADSGKGMTQADFEKALKTVSQKKAPKDDEKSTDSSAD